MCQVCGFVFFVCEGCGVAHACAGEAGKKRRVVVVVFIGGVTFAEVAALRWLGGRPEVNCAFVVATTKLINGTTLLESFVDEDAAAALQAAVLA